MTEKRKRSGLALDSWRTRTARVVGNYFFQMIVVFVVDTSPGMALPASSSASAKGLSKLDVSKMCIESTARLLDKRIIDHNRSVFTQRARIQEVGRLERFDEYLLLSTSLKNTAARRLKLTLRVGLGGDC